VRIARLLFAFGVLAGCDSQFGDTPVQPFVPPPAGTDHRIYEIRDPGNKQLHAKPGDNVAVSGVVVVAVDTYDETRNGKSVGTIYVADQGSKNPYSGISLFNPTWVPGNLRVGAGDALDLKGQYQENTTIPVAFAPGSALIQIASPVGQFRYEASLPDPVVIDVNDLQNFETGSKWLNMIVTVKNVTVQRDLFPTPASGRDSSVLTPEAKTGACTDPFPKAPAIVNELMDLDPLQIKQGTVLSSLTGIVTFFCNLHIAPRTAADIVIAK
jgi:hypothetical protein